MFGYLLLVAGFLAIPDLDRPDLVGTVTDQQGKPLAGARVDIATAAPRVGRGLFCPSCYLDCKKVARTDAEGRFLIEDVSPDLKFRLLVSKAGKKAQLTKLADPLAGNVQVSLADAPTNLAPEHTVRGRVVNAEGIPIEGALVEPVGATKPDQRWGGLVKEVDPTVTDAEGRFVMPLPDSFLSVDLEIRADGHAGLFVEAVVPNAPEHELRIPRGTSVSGRLLHEGAPLADARVSVVQVDRTSGRLFIKAVGATSDTEGRFTINYLPANEQYVLFSVVGEGPQEFVVATSQFTAKDNDQNRDLGDAPATRALRLAGRVVLPEGAKLRPNSKITLSRDPAWDLIAAPIAEDGRFEIGGLPAEAYEVRIAADGFQLDARELPFQTLSENSFGLRLRESKEDLAIPLVVAERKKAASQIREEAKYVKKPGGWLSGRVLADGKPLAGVTFSLHSSSDDSGRYASLGTTRTDEEGRYRIGGLKTGDRYMLDVGVPAKFSMRPWDYGSPFIRTVPDADMEAQLPDVELTSGGQNFKGVVVDPAGHPVTNVRVTARLADGQFLSAQDRRPRPWTETDPEGRFELLELPNETLDLMVHKTNPQGGSVRHPATVRPKHNDQEIRILFDPALSEPVAQLDKKP